MSQRQEVYPYRSTPAELGLANAEDQPARSTARRRDTKGGKTVGAWFGRVGPFRQDANPSPGGVPGEVYRDCEPLADLPGSTATEPPPQGQGGAR